MGLNADQAVSVELNVRRQRLNLINLFLSSLNLRETDLTCYLTVLTELFLYGQEGSQRIELI